MSGDETPATTTTKTRRLPRSAAKRGAQKPSATVPTRSDIAATEKAVKALNLRKVGATYDRIAAEVGYADRAAAWHAVQRELQRLVTPAVEELRALESERIDDLYRVVVAQALRGDLYAVDRVIKLMERRAKLLGLDLAGVRRDENEDTAIEIRITKRVVSTPERAPTAIPVEGPVVESGREARQ